MRLRGRQKIYTEFKEVNATNIIPILKKAYSKHQQNVREIQYLFDYERGEQPLPRPKEIRPEINIQVNSGLPNYIKRFKIGYFWGNPIMLVQRGNTELHETDSSNDDLGISSLNELLQNSQNISYQDQGMAEFVEISGVGHKMVDIKTDFPRNTDGDYRDALVDDYYLDSKYAFCVYHNGPGQKKVLGVSFTKIGSKLYFTCFTDKERFEITGWEIKIQQKNPLNMIPIVEFEKSYDRMGCFERQTSKIDALNAKESDMANDISQRTQELWWGDNVKFKEDDNGNPITPKSGQWVLTFSEDGKVAKIQPLSGTFDISGTLETATNDRITILQDAYVPIQYSSSGGGSTGVATDMSSGWSAAELDACQEQQMIEKGKREELELILRAIQFVPSDILPEDAPIRKVHSADVDFKFLRSKNYDMSIKANAFATYFNNGVHPRHALKEINAFPDVEQVYLDSKPMFDALQKKMVDSGSVTAEKNFNASSDTQNQIENSPILDGLNTSTNKQAV